MQGITAEIVPTNVEQRYLGVSSTLRTHFRRPGSVGTLYLAATATFLGCSTSKLHFWVPFPIWVNTTHEFSLVIHVDSWNSYLWKYILYKIKKRKFKRSIPIDNLNTIDDRNLSILSIIHIVYDICARERVVKGITFILGDPSEVLSTALHGCVVLLLLSSTTSSIWNFGERVWFHARDYSNIAFSKYSTGIFDTHSSWGKFLLISCP